MKKDKIQKIYEYIKENKLIDVKDIVIVGVSGGADSMALLYVLQELKNDFEIDIYVCHIHHGIREKEADEDARYVEEYCKENNLEYREFREDIKAFASQNSLSLEEAGRLKRYEIFKSLAKEVEKEGRQVKIAVAHNKNDNAETILMNMCRGTGLKGLSGIKAGRDNIIRPLLDTKREEIEDILKDVGISFRTDSTNLSDIYTRNIIRNKILPSLAQSVNSASLDNIVKSAEFINKADEFIQDLARGLAEEIFVYKNSRLVGFSFERLKKEKKILRTYVIRYFLEKNLNQLKDIEAVHIEMIDKLIFMETGKNINLPYKLRLNKGYDYISICFDNDETEYIHSSLEEDFELKVFKNKNFKIDDLVYTKYIDYDKIGKVLSFRTRQRGDYIHIKSGKKTVKAFMIDEKIEAKDRDKIPLVALGQDIIWIVGKRLSEKYKIDESTKMILEIKYKRGF